MYFFKDSLVFYCFEKNVNYYGNILLNVSSCGLTREAKT